MHYSCKLGPAFASLKSPKGVLEQATEPFLIWWKPQPGLHSNAAYTMEPAPVFCYGTYARKLQPSPQQRYYTVSNQNLKASCPHWFSEAKGLYASPDHIQWPSDPWNQLTPVDLVSSSFWIAENLLLPCYPLCKGLFASSCKGPTSSPVYLGFNRRLKNWSPANTSTQLCTLSQSNRNTLISQHPLTTILPKHPGQHPPPQLRL